jgi:hypothetical protein
VSYDRPITYEEMRDGWRATFAALLPDWPEERREEAVRALLDGIAAFGEQHGLPSPGELADALERPDKRSGDE